MWLAAAQQRAMRDDARAPYRILRRNGDGMPPLTAGNGWWCLPVSWSGPG